MHKNFLHQHRKFGLVFKYNIKMLNLQKNQLKKI